MLENHIGGAAILETQYCSAPLSQAAKAGEGALCVSRFVLAAGRRAACTGGYAAECRLSELEGKRMAYTVERIDRLVEKGGRVNAGKCQLGRDERICRSRGIALLARLLDKTSDRIADEAQHVRERYHSCSQALLGRTSEKLRRRACRHGRSGSDLCLAASFRSRNRRIARYDIA
jgi:hypothetical protein